MDADCVLDVIHRSLDAAGCGQSIIDTFCEDKGIPRVFPQPDALKRAMRSRLRSIIELMMELSTKRKYAIANPEKLVKTYQAVDDMNLPALATNLIECEQALYVMIL